MKTMSDKYTKYETKGRVTITELNMGKTRSLT